MTDTYFFDEGWPEERARLAALEVALDPGTIEHLSALRLGPGAHCLEVGAGGGSIAAWLCEEVGETGRVVACDVHTKFLAALHYPQLEVLHHDIAADPLPAGEFDVAHVRWTLFWLSPEHRDAAVRRMISSLRPGGVLVAEEPDFVSLLESPLPEPLRTVVVEHVRLVERVSRDVDVTYGRKLFPDLFAVGLSDITTVGRTHVIQPQVEATGASWLRFALERVREPMIVAGAVSNEEFGQAMDQFDEPATAISFPITMMVRGTRQR
jgi:SAM-dependent methyltransferase